MEKLIQEMREVNMESLAISPPEESKQFLDGNLSHSTINWIIKTAINELTSFFSLFLSFFFLAHHAAYVNCCIGKKGFEYYFRVSK